MYAVAACLLDPKIVSSICSMGFILCLDIDRGIMTKYGHKNRLSVLLLVGFQHGRSLPKIVT
jgi:hypothetical protein